MNHRITALTNQKHNRQRVNVYLDGEFAFGLTHIVGAWLSVGMEISDEKIATLRAEDEREMAYLSAIRYISYRPRAKAEVKKYLLKRQCRSEVISYVLDRLEAGGLVNDAQFAQNWVENRMEFRPRGRKAIEYELRQHGIDPQLIETSIEVIDEEEMAFLAARKQARKIDKSNWREFRQKMLRHLAQRGFLYDVSDKVIREIWDEVSNAEQFSYEGAQHNDR